MKTLRSIIYGAFLMLAVVVVGCSDYDDSELWKDIDSLYSDLNEISSQIESMQQQLDMLSAVVSGSGAITSITQDSDGNYLISYKDESNVEHTISVATIDDAVTVPIIGMKEDGGVWYWTTTTGGTTSWLLDTDGEKIPVTGRVPEIDVDSEGYWTVFGERITDSEGNYVKADGKTVSVITAVDVEDGYVTFTLGDGTAVTVLIQDGFNVTFNVDQTTVISDVSEDLVIEYTLVGETETSIFTVEKWEGIDEPVLDTDAHTITVTFPEDFDEGSLTVMFYDGEDNVIIKMLYFTGLEGEPTGICTVEDLLAFANAINTGRSVSKYMIDGEVQLMNDLDLSGVDWSEYVIGGIVTPSTTSSNTSVTYSFSDFAFSRTFNGNSHSLKNIDWTFDLDGDNIAYGLFSGLKGDGVIKDLTLEGKITVEGAARQGSTIGAIVGYTEGTITGVTNECDMDFAGTDASNVTVHMAGIAGTAMSGASISECVNEGDVTCNVTEITNTANGSNSGFHNAGICAYITGSSTLISDCTNNGAVSAPTGRTGGLIAVIAGGTLENSINNGFIQDDVNELFTPNTGYKRMGGLVGGTGSSGTVTGCTNNGNVFSQHGCRTGGFVGHNEGKVTGCTNTGIILSDFTVDGSNYHGPGWACGYNATTDYLTGCTIGGKVGDYSVYKDAPESTPDATYSNAVCHGKFDPFQNGLTDEDDEFYNWTVEEEIQLADAVTYTHYSFVNNNANIYVVSVDLTDEKVVLETVFADEICLNPNKNNNSNNGKNLRETLSETCIRRTEEGRDILAGINTGFFYSDLGFPRAMHIEYDEPVFVNNPYARQSLTNHRPGFTFYTDRTVSFDNRDFQGWVKSGDTEVEFYSVNDTIVAQNSARVGYEYTKLANIYTSRFKKEPHEGIFNTVGTDALFIVAKSDEELKINTEYISGNVTSVVDGRNGASIEVPFVEDRDEWVLQLTGDSATALETLKEGDEISIKMDVTIGSQKKSMIMHNGSMYRFLYNGSWNAVTSSDAENPYLATLIGADQAGTTVKMVCVGGSSAADGLDYYEYYRVMEKLGMYNAIRFDGGGSTCMWVKNSGMVCKSSDSKGDERSCLNYMHVRLLP